MLSRQSLLGLLRIGVVLLTTLPSLAGEVSLPAVVVVSLVVAVFVESSFAPVVVVAAAVRLRLDQAQWVDAKAFGTGSLCSCQ